MRFAIQLTGPRNRMPMHIHQLKRPTWLESLCPVEKTTPDSVGTRHAKISRKEENNKKAAIFFFIFSSVSCRPKISSLVPSGHTHSISHTHTRGIVTNPLISLVLKSLD
ncbi:hypothetical protein Pfo_016828 [Paulownia fortunei]|nr:hypothetical protein Pfo_016828 [Paulownia fortunei]